MIRQSGRSFGALGALAAIGLAACSSGSSTTTPVMDSSLPCESGLGVVSLAPLEALTVTCSAGTAIDLAGGGPSYLIVPQLAAGDVPFDTMSVVIGPAGAVVAPSAAALSGASSAHDLQARFDLALRARDRRAVGAGVARPNARSAAPSRSPAAVPALNSVRSFTVLSSTDVSNNATVDTVGARLSFIGNDLLLYVDTLAPSPLSSDDLNRIGTLFSQTLYPLDLDVFGSPTDIDGNGRLIALLTPVVNALTPSAQCQTDGYIAGFFDGFDLAFPTNPTSNGGEIFYTIVPDPSGDVSCKHSLDGFLATVPATFLHEVQHLISFADHVVVDGGAPEEGWLDEGLSRVAEELGSIHYEELYPPPTGRTNAAQLFPDSAEAFITGVLLDSYQYLLDPELETVTLHSDSDGGLAWRGAVWLLSRWLGDQFGTGIYRTLEESGRTGTANIAAAAGVPFDELFGDFSLALYTDSLPGVPRSAIPARDRFTSRNLRYLYRAVYNAAGGPSTDFPRPFPIAATALDGSAAVTVSLVPGAPSYYTLTTAPGSGSARIVLTRSGGGALAASLHPQVSIFRLQ